MDMKQRAQLVRELRLESKRAGGESNNPARPERVVYPNSSVGTRDIDIDYFKIDPRAAAYKRPRAAALARRDTLRRNRRPRPFDLDDAQRGKLTRRGINTAWYE